MREISYEEVRLSVDNITDNQSSLNVGELKNKADSLDSIVLILKECWNTTGGNKKQKRLKEIIDQELDFSKIESTIDNIKNASISYTTATIQETHNYGESLPNLSSIN